MRRFLALLLLLALGACGRDASPEEGAGVLHVGSQKGGTKALMLSSGVLEGVPYRIEWSEFPAAQHLLEAIGSGAVDIGLTGDAPFLFAYQSGSPVKAIGAQEAPERPAGALAIIVPAASPVRSLADLKGKTVATTRGSVGHYLVVRALAAAHLPPDYVKLSFLAPGDAKAAFSSGAIDAWSIWVPYLSAARQEEARVIVDGRGLVRGVGFDVANDRSAVAKRAMLADFLKREARAMDWAATHKSAFAAVLARETGLPLAIARDYAEKNKRRRVAIDAALIAEQRQVLDDFAAAGAITGGRKLNGAFDTSFK